MLDHVRELENYQEWADWQFFKRWKELSDANENEEVSLDHRLDPLAAIWIET